MAAAIDLGQNPTQEPEMGAIDITALAHAAGIDARVLVTPSALVQLRWERVDLYDVLADAAAEIAATSSTSTLQLLPTSPFLGVQKLGERVLEIVRC